MGIPEKPHVQMEHGVGVVESEGGGNKKWIIAGIQFRSPLNPIFTTTTTPAEKDYGKEEGDEEECSTTPTAKESRIPSVLTCPPAPRKRKPSSRCHFNSGVRDFFTPPDLESVFIRRVERA